MSDDDLDRVIDECSFPLEICSSGNYGSTQRAVKRIKESGQLHRLVVGTDTPGGTGVIPRGEAVIRLKERWRGGVRRQPGFVDTFLFPVSAISLDSVPVKAQPKNDRDTIAKRSGIQLGGSPCRKLKKAIRKIRNRRRTKASLRPMCRPTKRRKARASRPAARSRKRPDAGFGLKQTAYIILKALIYGYGAPSSASHFGLSECSLFNVPCAPKWSKDRQVAQAVLQSLQQFHISGRFRTSAPGAYLPAAS
jgi:hypothetical protein